MRRCSPLRLLVFSLLSLTALCPPPSAFAAELKPLPGPSCAEEGRGLALPKTRTRLARSAKVGPGCARKFGDFARMGAAVAAARSDVAQALGAAAQLVGAAPAAETVVAVAAAAAGTQVSGADVKRVTDAMKAVTSTQGRYLLVATTDVPFAVLANRAAYASHATAVLLATPDDAGWLDRLDGTNADGFLKMAFEGVLGGSADAVFAEAESGALGPAVVRRTAFVSVGGFDERVAVETGAGDPCGFGSLHRRVLTADLRNRIAAAGYRVASHDATGEWEPRTTPAPVPALPRADRTCAPRAPPTLSCASASTADSTPPVATVILQYFRRARNVARIGAAMRRIPVEVMVNDDSLSEVGPWLRSLPRAHGWLHLAQDIHEIRAYNRLVPAASTELVVLGQDDDVPSSRDRPVGRWLAKALVLFRRHPAMGMLGAYRGRFDDGKRMKGNNCNDGSKFGAEPGADPLGETKRIPSGRGGFMFIYKVNMGPLIIRRSIFQQLGMFNVNFSCAGHAGMGFDFEYSVRLWKEGFKVGLYDARWAHRIGDSMSTGTHKGKANAITRVNERRNNAQLYKMFPGFHHRRGTEIAKRANRLLRVRQG